MILVTAATEMEMRPFRAAATGVSGYIPLLTGVGPVEATLAVSRFLARSAGEVGGVVNLGVAGAYEGSGVGLLDICLATSEALGDFGICYGNQLEPFSGPVFPSVIERLDPELRRRAGMLLSVRGAAWAEGNFVTVSGTTATAERGRMLRQRFDAICENMEGFAVARVCRDFGLPCLELRCVSNRVEDRDPGAWKLSEACAKGGEVAALVVAGLTAATAGKD